MPQITISGTTTTQQLQNFAQQLGDNAKVRGKVNDDGSVTLYTSKKIDTGFKEHFFGHVTSRQNGARAGLEKLVDNLRNDPGISEDAKGLLSNLAKPGGEIRGSDLKQFLTQVHDARATGLSTERKLADAIESGDQHTINQVRDHYIDQMSQAWRNAPREDQMRFAASEGEDYKGNMGRIMDQHLGGVSPFKDTYQGCSEGAKKFLDEVYDGVALSLSDRVVSDNKVEVDGKVYTKEKELARGGNGIVDLYKADDNTQIVIKRALTQLEGGFDYTDEKHAFKDNGSEAIHHLKAMEVSGDNVIEMKGAFRTPGGGLMIALKLAPGGDSYSAITNINSAVTEGLITPKQGELMQATMLKDMLQSLQAFQEGGMSHQDLKPPNYFIDDGGKVKMGDFGTTRMGAEVRQEKRLVDNPRWLSPDILNSLKSVTVAQNLTQSNLTPIDTIREQLKGTMPKKDLEALLDKVQKDRDSRTERFAQGTAKFTQKSDTWAVGVSAHQMFYNNADPLGMSEMKFMNKKEQALRDFGVNSNLVFTPKEGEQLTDQQNLINELMHPDPNQRSSPEKALESPVFSEPGVGSQQVRDFLMDPLLRKSPDELTDQDKEQLRQKSGQLGF